MRYRLTIVSKGSSVPWHDTTCGELPLRPLLFFETCALADGSSSMLKTGVREHSNGTSSLLQLLQRLLTIMWRVDLPFCTTRCWMFDSKRESFVGGCNVLMLSRNEVIDAGSFGHPATLPGSFASVSCNLRVLDKGRRWAGLNPCTSIALEVEYRGQGGKRPNRGRGKTGALISHEHTCHH